MILIKNGILVDPVLLDCTQLDLVIDHGKIKEKGKEFQEEDFDEVIDVSGMYVAPGLIDGHVHFRDPGFTYKEDIITGANAAKKGGFTAVINLANTNPPVDNLETLNEILKKGRETGIHVLCCGAITKGMHGTEIISMEEMKKAGAVGFTDDGIPITDALVVKRAMEEAKRLNVPLSFHEEDPAFIENSGINSGKVAEKLGMGGASSLAEEVLVARDGLLALHTGCKINIQHISSKNSVKLVKMLRKLGADIHAEATPHHFSLDETAILKYGTLAKMNPPLRTEEDREAIINGLADGTIDVIVTDHAPHSQEEKSREFQKAPSGIIGLETSLALGITNLVRTKRLSMEMLIRKMTYNPAQLYGLDFGTLENGKNADLVIFNPNEKFIVNSFASKSNNSPFRGWELYGKIYYTICDGNVVYRCM